MLEFVFAYDTHPIVASKLYADLVGKTFPVNGSSHAQGNYVANFFGRETGPLGFGCGLLLQAGDRRSAVRLLGTAFDHGIEYFDTARLYADGLAEGMLREAFANRRDKVILVSKAGILPTSCSLLQRATRKTIHLVRKVPGTQSLFSEPAAAGPTFGVFDIPRLRASVETSLKELGTDYIDGLLLHECTAEDAAKAEIRAFAEELVKEGKIRAYGVAPRVSDAIEIERQGIAFGTIMQVAGCVLEEQRPTIGRRDGRLLVTHSVLGDRIGRARDRLKQDATARETLRAALNVDPSDGAAMARLCLRLAMYLNNDGVVLFSTTRAERIRSNIKATEQPISDSEAPKMTALLSAI